MSLSRYRALFANRVPVIVSAAMTTVACAGTAGGPSDASSDAPPDIGCNPPVGQIFDVTYDVCVDEVDAGTDAAPDVSADAAPLDASSDGTSEAGAVDAGRCWYSCMEACGANKPYGPGQSAACLQEISRVGSKVTVRCQVQYLCGRRLEGLDEPDEPGLSQVGIARVLAEAAWLEAASVRSFRRLARELRAHDAPAELVSAAETAARDEVRHARTMARLARKHGAEPPKVRVARVGRRSLEAIAVENAVEACVGETYGAALAAWQAAHARDPEVKRALAAIAPDEANHAALAWAVREWTASKLDADANARVRAAERVAIARLRVDAATGDDADVARAIGLPSASESAALVDAVDREVWSVAA